MTIAFIGLGNMGYHIAGHLSATGDELRVFNRSKPKQARWLNEYKGNPASSANEAAAGADVIFLCVGNDSDIRQVIFGDGGLGETLKSGAIIVDHTTASAAIAKEMSSYFAGRGSYYLDAPLSGGTSGAKAGALACFMGGDAQAGERVRPYLDKYCKAVFYFGKSGAGQLAKMANQVCIVNNLKGVAEALRFATANGLDPVDLIPALAKGAAQSWQLENRGSWMLSAKYKEGGFAVDLILKDLTLCQEAALSVDVALPGALLAKQKFEQLTAEGKGRWDFSAIIETFSDK